MARNTADDPSVRRADAANGGAGVLVVDDQKAFRDVMRAVVEATPGLRIVGEAGCGEEALRAVDELTPELVIVDVRMPGMDGVEVARILFERNPAPAVLLVSAQSPPTGLPTASDGTAVAFLAKEHLRPKLLLEFWTRRAQPNSMLRAHPAH
jgi:DNA-binding NarL/FixJ family response regulator